MKIFSKINFKKIKLDRKTVLRTLFYSVLVFVGTFLMAFGNMAFFLPHDIIPGGFTGLATVLHLILVNGLGMTGVLTRVFSIGNIALIINVPLFLWALKVKGKNFGILSVVGTIGYSISIDIWSGIFASNPSTFLNITGDDYLLAVVYGGIFMGVGYGFVIRLGGSTGGSDMLATVLNAIRPGMSFGTILLFIDGFVVLCSGTYFALSIDVAYGIQSALYAFLGIFLSTRVADFIIEGKQSTRTYFVISRQPQNVADVLVKYMGRGVTAVKSRGAFSNQEREMLMCVVRRGQSGLLKRLVFETDPHAFVFASNAVEVLGEGFRTPDVKKKRRDFLQFARPNNEDEIVAMASRITLESNDKTNSDNLNIDA